MGMRERRERMMVGEREEGENDGGGERGRDV